jgi:hypothetical protein
MTPPPILIVSGGTGASGEHLVRAVLAQFRDSDVPVIILAGVREVRQIEAAVNQAAASGGLIVHTLVDVTLRGVLIDLARERNVDAIDLMGSLFLHLTHALGQEPVGQPGLYHSLREDYFKRIAAIEFTVDHDDGKRAEELHLAEIVLTGVSRVGKTPLSMYLSTRGWKVANVPLVPNIPPPPHLLAIDHRRVVGLTIDPGELASYRSARQHRLGMAGKSEYTDPTALYDELDNALRIFRRGQFAVLDITDRPIEESAEEIIALLTKRLRD